MASAAAAAAATAKAKAAEAVVSAVVSVPGASTEPSRAKPSTGAARPPSLREQSLAPEFVAKWEEDMGFTEEQQTTMREFRQAMADAGVLSDWWDNKPTFFRFCQARQWDVEKALLMFSNHLAWRKENNMDVAECVDTPSGPAPRILVEYKYPEITEVKHAYPFNHHKVDKAGLPMYFDRIGTLDIKKIHEVSSTDRLLEYFTWYSEATVHYRLAAASVAAGRYIGKSVYVMDMRGFGISKFGSDMRAFLKTFTKIASENYPEVMEKTYIVHAPWVFQKVWGFVAPLLDPRTASKFVILGGPSEFLPRLQAHLDIDDLPEFLGGKDTSCDFVREVGPWAEYVPALK